MNNLNNFQEAKESIEIYDKIHWVGFYESATVLRCNPCLIINNGDAILINPGPVTYFPVIARKIFSLIKPEQISHIILSHSGPDICGSLPLLEGLIGRSDLKIVCSRHESIFIANYGITSDFYFTDENDNVLQLPTDRTLKFIDANFIPSPGAIFIYDEISKILFSGMLFNSFEKHGEWRFYADETYPEHLAKFMKICLSSREIVSRAIDKLENLEIEMIVPHHGLVIKSHSEVKKYLEMAKNLNYGSK